MPNKIDLTGNRYGKLVVLSEMLGRNIHGNILWLCQCDCGNTKAIIGGSLKNGSTTSCGCHGLSMLAKNRSTHGNSSRNIRSKEYQAWDAMIQRCTNSKSVHYSDYGGRGIKVCDRWLNDFESFLADMGKKPSDKHSLDRFPNVNGNYEKSNCRWALWHQQCRNKRSNVWIEYNGERKIISDWASLFKIKSHSIRRSMKRGKTFEQLYKYYTNK